MAAVRQNEMNVNITLVTTRTLPAVGPRRLGRGVLVILDESASDDLAGRSPAAISVAFRGASMECVTQVDEYSGPAGPASSGPARRREWVPLQPAAYQLCQQAPSNHQHDAG